MRLADVVRREARRLLLHCLLCYKPNMRKWMRERIQRRKKKAPEQTDQPVPPPLQPAYFDAEQAPAPATEAARGLETPVSRPVTSEESLSRKATQGEAERSQDSQSARQPSSSGPAARGRGRRRRGGRGRSGGGRERAVAEAFSPAAIKSSLPLAPTETSLGEQPPAAEVEAPAVPPVAEAPKLPPVPAAAPRAPRGVVVLAIGLPGSGKSSWFKRHNVVPLSSDSLRALLFDDVREQRFQDIVFSNLRSLLKARLIARRPMNYVDATNLTPQERHHWIKLAKDYNYEVHAVFFDVPLEVCIERHQRRDRVVPEDVMRRMAAKLKPPSFEEGFAKITVVRVKKKE
jgi:predicted kinase